MTYYRYTGFYRAMREDLGRIGSAYCSFFVWLIINAMLETEREISEAEILDHVLETLEYHSRKRASGETNAD